ncbi:MAG: DNA polymerase domain-containing protein [Kiritimatiellia bacterium]
METRQSFYDPLLFGADTQAGIVAIESLADRAEPSVRLFVRNADGVQTRDVGFQPFLLTTEALATKYPSACERVQLTGKGRLNARMAFKTWKQFVDARQWLQAETGESPGSPSAPYLAISDPVRQYMLQTGATHFKGMQFEELHRMQFDIECITSPGFDFCNAEREGDRIVAIGLADQSGWTEVVGGKGESEAEILQRFLALVQERDPDVLEGHNCCNFDLPYIAARAALHKIPFALGRDGSVPRQRSSQISVGERMSSYTRFDVYGRHVIDTFFLAQAYDQSHRALDSLGLKAVALHFHVAAENRTYIAGGDITDIFHRAPETLCAYVLDDVTETRAISDILSRSAFVQARMLPLGYQDTAVRGNAVKIDQLLLRAYYQRSAALPKPEGGRPIAGGYTDVFMEGVVRPVHHCDVRSLYPSLMLTQRLGPASDDAGVFLALLDLLRTFRLDAKKAMQLADGASRQELDAMQTTFKILINSFYGYLGFTQGRFNDFSAADRITSEGRNLLADMVLQLETLGAKPVEIDTDGIYYIPPPDAVEEHAREAFRSKFIATLPAGITVEFDDEYAAMYSYKMKNYALLRSDGEIIIKGAALKSRGLERFQRDFLRRLITLKLAGKDKDIPKLKQEFDGAIQNRKLPIEDLAKSETLSDSLAVYQRKRDQEGGSKRAAYELALQAGKTYRAGDQVLYYVTGNKKNVAVHESAKLVADWNPDERDENVVYYQAKLDALYEKFGGVPVVAASAQGELF